jgi:hypothetical protein
MACWLQSVEEAKHHQLILLRSLTKITECSKPRDKSSPRTRSKRAPAQSTVQHNNVPQSDYADTDSSFYTDLALSCF